MGEQVDTIRRVCSAFALLVFSAPAVAAPKYVVHAVQTGSETARFDQGVATLDLMGKRGAVQLRPLPMEHGSLVFSIAIWNDADQPLNFDVTNIQAEVGQQTLRPFTADELVAKAENRAMWTQIGIAVVGGLAAASAAANNHNTYRTVTTTPSGVYTSTTTVPNYNADLKAAASVAAAGAGIAVVQSRLDETRARLGNEIVQLSTVDPGSSYAGRIVLQKVKSKELPVDVRLYVDWNGERYPFTFRVAKRGTPAPIFTALTTQEGAATGAQSATNLPDKALDDVQAPPLPLNAPMRSAPMTPTPVSAPAGTASTPTI